MVVVGTFGAAAIAAAEQAVRAGANAMDGVLMAALGQTVLAAGCWDSFAGILSLLYFEARSGQVHALNAGYNTVLAEDQPLTIPRRGSPSGRTALVPGFMAGIGAAHARFGSLPFSKLFDPAIALAEDGFPLDAVLTRLMRFRADVLTASAEAARIFTRRGKLLREAETLRQPELAKTLRQTARRGAEFMYRGDWARGLTQAVARRGGKMTLNDLRRYRPIWDCPVETRYRRCRVFAPPLPGMGGIYLAEALNLLVAGQDTQHGHYSAAAESLYRMIQVTRARYLPPLTHPADRAKTAWAENLWKEISRQGGLSFLDSSRVIERLAAHSDGVLAADRWGNVAALCHSANSVVWGTSGIFVGGVGIPDSASFQQAEIAAAGPGARLPESMNPVIILSEQKPLLASVAIGAALHELTLQNLINLIDFDMTPRQAAEAPHFLGPDWFGIFRLLGYKNRFMAVLGETVFSFLIAASLPFLPYMRRRTDMKQMIEKGRFRPEVVERIRALGQAVREVDQRTASSSWAGLRFRANEVQYTVSPDG
jgi:gamma-glutamyltranspeptidase/glutathione hydrolase